MKKLLLFILVCAPGIVSAQRKSIGALEIVPIVNGRIVYTEIDTASGTKDELYNRAKIFLSSVFPNFSNVVKLDDKELGSVRIRGIFNTLDNSKKGMIISYLEFYAIVDIQVKDGRYKYEISDFTQSDTGYPLEATMYNRKRIMKVSKEMAPYMNNFVHALKIAMAGKSAQNNW